MKRRTFIKKSSMTAFSISAFGSIQWNGQSYVADTPTTTDILGPFYRPGAPLLNNLIPPGSKGTPLHLTGTIYQNDGKTPLSNALVEIWHCDENAHYDNTSDDYVFRGAAKTGRNGKYDFKTILPVPYQAIPNDESSWRPAHIHMRISSQTQQDLITQIYFKGDRYISTDPSAKAPQAANRILEISQNASHENRVTFDIVMSKEFSLDLAAYQRITGLYQFDHHTIEFFKSDDLLFMKWNGQLMSGFKYLGNNTFGDGYDQVSFELSQNGGVKAILSFESKTYTGAKFLKYPD